MELHQTHLGERGSRVVFCHGLFGQGRNWTEIGKTVAGQHRVSLVDMPNHGRSGWTEHLAYPELADQVATLLSAADPVTLVGHSMGGKIAMCLALRHPELVARLVVVDMSPVDYHQMSDFGGYIAAMQRMDLARIQDRPQAEAALRDAVPDPVIRNFLLQNLRRADHGWRWQANLDLLGREHSVLAGWPAAELAGSSYDGPTLWIGGERSNYITADHLPAMQQLFPRVRRVTVRGAGHWVHSENPQVFTEVLQQFLAATADPAAG